MFVRMRRDEEAIDGVCQAAALAFEEQQDDWPADTLDAPHFEGNLRLLIVSFGNPLAWNGNIMALRRSS
jgi:hypothetical protein